MYAIGTAAAATSQIECFSRAALIDCTLHVTGEPALIDFRQIRRIYELITNMAFVFSFDIAIETGKKKQKKTKNIILVWVLILKYTVLHLNLSVLTL